MLHRLRYAQLLWGALLPPSVIYLFYCEVTEARLITEGTLNSNETHGYEIR